MLSIKKILLPVDFPNVSMRVIREAATLARHFHSEIVLLHVVTAASHIAGVPQEGAERTGWDLLAEIIRRGNEEGLDQPLGPELDGITIQRVLVKGGAAHVIVRAAYEEKADLIMMPSRGHTFDEFLLGSEAVKLLQGNDCPVWTGAHGEESNGQNFAIRNVLCAVDCNTHDRKTVTWAMQIAAEFGARLTLAHVTASVKFWGPGGNHVDRRSKEALVGDAADHIAALQKETGAKSDVFIGSGDGPKVLCQAAKRMQADLLVTGCRPYGGCLRTRGYAIICAVPIPVLSV